MVNSPWTPAEIEALRTTAGMTASAAAAKLPGRTINAIRTRQTLLGIPGAPGYPAGRGNGHTDAIRARIRPMLDADMTYAAIGEAVARTPQAIGFLARGMGYRRGQGWHAKNFNQTHGG